MRVFVDTNVLLSSILRPEGPPGQILEALHQERYGLVTSEEQLMELRRTLGYQRVRRRTAFSEEEGEEWVDELASLADVVTQPAEVPSFSRDPDDNGHLAAALAGRADLFVSGDKDVLSLRMCKEMPIVTPAKFLEILG